MRLLVRLAAFFVTFFSFNYCVFAQETTATLNGVVSDGQGQLIGGATVSVIHVPTGTKTETQTNSRGIFVMPNLRPGGPYTITISFVGFEDQKFENVNLNLGNNPEVRVDLKNSQ